MSLHSKLAQLFEIFSVKVARIELGQKTIELIVRNI